MNLINFFRTAYFGTTLKKKMLSRAIVPRRTFAVIRMRGASKVDKEGMPESKHPIF